LGVGGVERGLARGIGPSPARTVDPGLGHHCSTLSWYGFADASETA
jgi:hypothetical protein